MLRADDAPKKIFLTYLFSDQALTIQFLKDVGLIRSKVPWNTCGRDMTWCTEPNLPEGFRWQCWKKIAGAKCRGTVSIKHGSWFQQSNLTFLEILLITYDSVRREPVTKSKMNCPWVSIQSQIGTCFSGKKLCRCSCRAAPRISVVLISSKGTAPHNSDHL
jgi:hypothetical protein